MSGDTTKTNSPQITICANKIVKDSLESILESSEIKDLCTFEICQGNEVIIHYDGQKTAFSLPLRIGTLFDRIKQISDQFQSRNTVIIDLIYGELNVNLGTFVPFGKTKKSREKVVLLTEKEVEILHYLHNNIPRKISREELLESIWNYAKNAETHTLETHIYRLRQKIEPEPASPLILRKDEEGYFLGQAPR